jgi:CheY-like chemotaxis protein
MQLQSFLHILLADDDLDDHFFFKRAIRQLKIHATVSAVTMGDQLLKFLQEKKAAPNIIFLDINMPRKNGIECLQEIKEDSRFKDIPVIMLSSSSSESDIEESFSKGASFYIIKPVLQPELVEILRKVFCFDWKEKLPQPAKDKFVMNGSAW